MLHSSQVVLQRLTHNEHASLLQVSKSISGITLQHAPYIVMRLSSSTREEYLQQLLKASKQLQQVPGIHKCISGAVPAARFNLAVQLLAQKFKQVGVLQLHGVNDRAKGYEFRSVGRDNAASEARITTLQPITLLMPQLLSTVVVDVAVCDIARNLRQFAGAASAADEEWS